MGEKTRCKWVTGGSELYLDYHDREWACRRHDDCVLFEFLILEGAQAGLSWSTILNKREGYRKAFSGFDPKVARYDKTKINKLLQDPAIVRNRLKVESAAINARAFLDMQEEFGSFDAYIWRSPAASPYRIPGGP
jgi:DNA-3-methyladenine glycosylase I